MGSASEVEYHFLLAHDLKYLNVENYRTLNERVLEVKRMLSALLVRVNEDRQSKPQALRPMKVLAEC